MTYHQLAYLHLATVVPAFFIGSYLFLKRKGTAGHRLLGKAYLSLMGITAVTTLFMSARVGPTLWGHFGFIHLFSLLVFYAVPAALLAARAGNVRKHRSEMIGLYVGGVLIAGAFAFSPGRLLNKWLFSVSGFF